MSPVTMLHNPLVPLGTHTASAAFRESFGGLTPLELGLDFNKISASPKNSELLLPPPPQKTTTNKQKTNEQTKNETKDK